LIGAIVLVVFGGLFAAIDAAINTVSIARVDELIRDERPGAVRLAKIIRNRPQYVNLVVLLRVVCEASATVLLVDYLDELMTRGWALVSAAAIMVVVSFVAIGVGPRTVGRQNAYSISLLSAALPARVPLARLSRSSWRSSEELSGSRPSRSM